MAGQEVPRLEVTEPENPEIQLKEVVKNIYCSCDPDNTNLVKVSTLLDFIGPYMAQDSCAIDNLKTSLDPESVNPSIPSSHFFNVMSEWARKYHVSSDNEFNRTPSNLDQVDEKNLPYIQSTPRASFGQKLLNGSGLLNLSFNSSTIETSNIESKVMLEEQIQKLEHQIQKMCSEMDLVKFQLVATEEQNELLVADLAKVNKTLQAEQHANEVLRRDQQECEELQEELQAVKRQVEVYKQKLLVCEKEQGGLKNANLEIIEEKKKVERKFEEMCRNEQEARKVIFEIQKEIELKEQKITTLAKENDALKYQLGEQKDLIDNFANENELLRHKKESLEKTVRDCLLQKSESFKSHFTFTKTPKTTQRPPHTLESNTHKFNSPKLLRQLSTPVSPCLDSPQSKYFSLNNSSSPIFPLENKLLQKVLLSNSSTPKDTHNKILLDNSLPAEMQSCPILSPSIANNSDNTISSPPIMYVVTRSPHHLSSVSLDQVESEHIDQSSDEDLLWKVQSVQENSQPHSPHESLQSEIAKVSQKEERESNYSFELNEQLVQLEENNQYLSEKLQEYKSTIDSLTAENALLQEELLQMKSEKDQLLAKLNDSESGSSRNKEMKDLNKRIKSDADWNKFLQEKLHLETFEKSVKLQELNQSVTELENKNLLLDSTLSQVQKEFDLKNNEITESNRKIEGILLRIQGQETKEETRKSLENNIIKIEELLLEKMENITDLREALKDDNETKNGLWRNIQVLMVKHDILASQNKDCELKIETKTIENETLKSKITTLEEDFQIKDEQIRSLQNKVEEDRKQICILSNMREAVKEKLSEAERLIQEHGVNSKNFQDLEEKLRQKDFALQLIQEKAETTAKEYDINYGIIHELEEKLKEANLVMQELLQKNLEMKKCSEVKQNEINCLTKEHNAFNNDVNQILERLNLLFGNVKVVGDSKTEKLRHFVDMLLSQKEDIATELKQVKLEMEKLKKGNNWLESSSNSQLLEGSLSKTSSELKNSSFDKKRLKMEKMQDKLEKLEKTNSKLQSLILEKDAAIFEKNNLRMELDRLQENVIAMQSSHAVEIRVYTEQMVEMQKLGCLEKQQLQSQIHQMEQELRLSQAEFRKLEADNVKTLEVERKKLAQLNEDYVNLEKANMFLEKQLQDEQAQNSSLKKILVNISSNSDDHKELIDKEEKLRGTKGLLQSTEKELNMVSSKLKVAKEELACVTNEVTKYSGCIFKSKQDLSSIIDNWKMYFKKQNLLDSDYERFLKEIDDKSSKPLVTSSVVETEIAKLNDQISVVCILVEILSNNYCPKPAEEFEFDMSGESSNPPIRTSPRDINIKKFTLRPPRFLASRPASPDSPSIDIGIPSNVPCSQKIFFPGGIGAHGASNSDSGEMPSPDNSEGQVILHNRRNGTFECEESIKKIDEEFEEIPYQEAFPNLSNSFLESVGLHETSAIKKLTKEETEHLFTTLVIQIALDSKDTNDRRKKQEQRCMQLEHKFLVLIKETNRRLREHKCIGAQDSVSPVFIMLEEMKCLVKEVLKEAGQFGVLCYETRMMKCWNLVTQYMAMLRQDVNSGSSPSIKNDSSSQILMEISPINTENVRNRSKCLTRNHKPPQCTNGTVAKNKNTRFSLLRNNSKAIYVVFFIIAIIVTVGFLLFEWHCQIIKSEEETCPFDDISKKIFLGPPPY